MLSLFPESEPARLIFVVSILWCARGYKKGKEKKQAGNFKLVRRTTDPQTVYVKNALHRDDIVDITDFDYVKYLYDIDRLMLNEELAIAMMLGDGREDGDEGKIDPDKIRPFGQTTICTPSMQI